MVNCNTCGLIWSTQDAGLIGNLYDDLVNSTFTCKSCLLEAKLEKLTVYIHDTARSMCAKIDTLNDEILKLQNENAIVIPKRK